MKAENPKQQRTRLAAGMLARYTKRDNETVRHPCSIEDVPQRVRALSPPELQNLTANVDWLVAYEAGEPS